MRDRGVRVYMHVCVYMHASMSECECDCVCARESVLCVIVRCG